MHNVKAWTVIFFIDNIQPTKVALLKRSRTKEFAPGFYTGIGGKIGDVKGCEHKTPLEGAYRELQEETDNQLSRSTTPLTEFARCIIDDNFTIYYFWSQCEDLPTVDKKDGELQWVDIRDVLKCNLIPTTKTVCMEWSRRNFTTKSSFTVFVTENGIERNVSLVEMITITDGLATTK